MVIRRIMASALWQLVSLLHGVLVFNGAMAGSTGSWRGTVRVLEPVSVACSEGRTKLLAPLHKCGVTDKNASSRLPGQASMVLRHPPNRNSNRPTG